MGSSKKRVVLRTVACRIADNPQYDRVHETLLGLRLGSEVAFEGLMVFPLVSENGQDPNCLTLDQPLERGTGRITAVSEGGSVPVRETGDLTILVAAKSSVAIPAWG